MKLQVTGSRNAWTYAVLSDDGRAVWTVGPFPSKEIAEELGFQTLKKEEESARRKRNQ